jgi:hypothetical protein
MGLAGANSRRTLDPVRPRSPPVAPRLNAFRPVRRAVRRCGWKPSPHFLPAQSRRDEYVASILRHLHSHSEPEDLPPLAAIPSGVIHATVRNYALVATLRLPNRPLYYTWWLL